MSGMAATRPNPPLRHMIVAILVVLAPALLAVAWFTRLPEPAVNVVDPAPAIAAARTADVYPIAVPQALPEGWRCTRARWIPVGAPGIDGTAEPGNAFALGYLSPTAMYVAVDQRDAAQDALVARSSRDGRPDGESQVSGRTWQRYLSEDKRTRSLVLREATVVTVVSGDLPYQGLESFAATLSFSG